MTKSTWISFKEKLVKRSPWLEPLVPGFAELLVSALTNNKIEKVHYNPLLIEPVTKDIASILDRCLVYRRDAQDLEILAVKAAADYGRFLDTAEQIEQIETLSVQVSRMVKERDGALTAATAFGSVAGTGVCQGMHADAIGRADALAAGIQAGTQQVNAIAEKWKTLRHYEDEAAARHTEPYNSQNFVERAKRLIRLLAEDFQEAHAKSEAIFTGVQAVFGQTFNIPPLTAASALDDLVLEIRRLSRFLESQSLLDLKYDLVIPLVQPWALGTANSKALVTAAELFRAISHGSPLFFDLSAVFANDDVVRLREVGISFGNTLAENMDPGRAPTMASYRLNAILTVPAQPGDSGDSRHVVFGNVGVFAGAPKESSSSSRIYNADPRGSWCLKIGSHAVFSLGVEPEIQGLIQDIKLHLSVVTGPKQLPLHAGR